MCVEGPWPGYVRLKKRGKKEDVCISVCICVRVCFLPFLPQLYPDGRRAESAKLTEKRKRHSP